MANHRTSSAGPCSPDPRPALAAGGRQWRRVGGALGWRRRGGRAPLLAALCLAAAGCGGSAHAAGSSSRSSGSSATHLSATGAPTRVRFGSGSVGAPDPTTTVPTEVNGAPVPPTLGAGQNVIITAHGFEPQTLEANVTAPVVWTNESGAPQRIVFVGVPVDSGTIPPGGTFTWSTKDALTLAYHSTEGWVGKLAMNQANP